MDFDEVQKIVAAQGTNISNDAFWVLEDGSCYYPNTTTEWHYTFYYECYYWYAWTGMEAANAHTLANWRPTIYVILMILVGLMCFLTSSLSAYVFSIKQDLKLVVKSYLLVGALFSFLKGIELFFRVQCIIFFREDDQYPSTQKYKRFNCLDTTNYPWCGFVINQVISNVGGALPYGYRMMMCFFTCYQFTCVFFYGRFERACAYLAPLLIFLSFALPSTLFITSIGAGEDFKYYFGDHFDPINYVVASYWGGVPSWPGEIWMIVDHASIAIDIVFLLLEIALISKFRSMRSTSFTKKNTDTRLQVGIVFSHLALGLSWVCHFFLDFSLDTKKAYISPSILLFITHNLSEWIVGFVVPLIFTYFVMPESWKWTRKRKSRPAKSFITATASELQSRTSMASKTPTYPRHIKRPNISA